MLSQTFEEPLFRVHIATVGRNESLDTTLAQEPFKFKQPIFAEQIHSNSIGLITEPNTQTYRAVDGLISNYPSHCLVIRHADCLPIVFWHPDGYFGALHAGRKSTEHKIVGAALEIIARETEVENISRFWFGPAICQPCYQIEKSSDTHYNLVRENRQQLEKFFHSRNLNSPTITMTDQCTSCGTDSFYSYRADGPGKPMNYSVVTLQTH
ncbi:polyphenol oxidase family protein [Candidatus Woesebacteria bacterium]|nr:polyphenol oxidase family protein [Candidatus Woesebacteria bacterium]